MRLLPRFFIGLLIFLIVVLMAAQIAAGFFLTPILEREGRRIFLHPVQIEKSGANFLLGSLWMKNVRVKNADGFESLDVLNAKKFTINLRLTSLLTNQLVWDHVKLVEPKISVEINEAGEWNVTRFAANALRRFRKFTLKKRKLLNLITRYELEKLSIRNGVITFQDHRTEGRKFTSDTATFSLARVLYPPDPEEALPVAIFLSATLRGTKDAQLLVLGRFNPFAGQKSFDVTGSVKNLKLGDYASFLPAFPLEASNGTFELKVKALAHDDQLDLSHHVTARDLSLGVKPGRETETVFGLPPAALVYYFDQHVPKGKSVEFDFRVMGDLSDPNFDLLDAVEDGFVEAVRSEVSAAGSGGAEGAEEAGDGTVLKIETDSVQLEVRTDSAV